MDRGRVLTIAVVVVAAAVAASFVDWRFWYRWETLPTDPGEWPASYYKPVSVLPGAEAPFFPAAADAERGKWRRCGTGTGGTCVVPFAVEVWGRQGQAAGELLARLAAHWAWLQ